MGEQVDQRLHAQLAAAYQAQKEQEIAGLRHNLHQAQAQACQQRFIAVSVPMPLSQPVTPTYTAVTTPDSPSLSYLHSASFGGANRYLTPESSPSPSPSMPVSAYSSCMSDCETDREQAQEQSPKMNRDAAEYVPEVAKIMTMPTMNLQTVLECKSLNMEE